MKRRVLSVLLASCLAALLAGCAKGLATPEQDARARLLRPVPDMSVIYLLRDRGDLYVTEVEVAIDNRIMGSTWPNTFFRWEVPAGDHVLVSYTKPPAVLKLRTAPGGVYYVWQDINTGREREPSRLQVVDEITARFTMDHARLLENKPPSKTAAQ